LTWRSFWQPQGKGYFLFFSKFLLFSILGFFLWSAVRSPYNLLLEKLALDVCQNNYPFIDHRFTQERGTYEVMFRPYKLGPIQPLKDDPIPVKIFFNTLHFNIIPFLAFLFASPFVNWKRFFFYLVVGLFVLIGSHYLHMRLDINAAYFRYQVRQGYFATENLQLTPEQFRSLFFWLWKLRALDTIQAFMEQAGSMIMPAFLWMIYANQWIFSSLLTRSRRELSAKAGK
jgi:hypothetical protein